MARKVSDINYRAFYIGEDGYVHVKDFDSERDVNIFDDKLSDARTPYISYEITFLGDGEIVYSRWETFRKRDIERLIEQGKVHLPSIEGDNDV